MPFCNGTDTGHDLPDTKESRRPVGVPLRESFWNYIKEGKQINRLGVHLLTERFCSHEIVLRS
jgi:hypothetical protein